jgi:PKHD-type hydroxylase
MMEGAAQTSDGVRQDKERPVFLEFDGVLTPQEILRLRALGRGARFAEGRLSNPHSTVKNNLQIDHADPGYAEAAQMLAIALQRHEGFRNFAYPRMIAPPMLAKYGPGMSYGLHTDAAFLPIGQRALRSDLSCTIFIAGPQDYEGGELAIQLGTRQVMFKGAAGSAIVYPSTTLHEVLTVRSGERLVGLTFVESKVADPALRELLYNLDEVAALEGLRMRPENRNRLDYVRNNLRRMWSGSE